jgi:hypothetical protein
VVGFNAVFPSKRGRPAEGWRGSWKREVAGWTNGCQGGLRLQVSDTSGADDGYELGRAARGTESLQPRAGTDSDVDDRRSNINKKNGRNSKGRNAAW